MQPLARAGRNVLFKTLGEVLARLSFLALFLVAARLLGAEEYGRYNYAASLAGLALVGMDLGLSTLLVRQVARQPPELGAYAGTLLLLKLLLALLMLASRPLGLVLAVALAQACWGLAELGFAGLTACEAMDQEAWIKSAARMAALVCAGGLLWGRAGLGGLVAGLLAANLLGMALALAVLRRRSPFAPRLEAAFVRRLLGDSLPPGPVGGLHRFLLAPGRGALGTSGPLLRRNRLVRGGGAGGRRAGHPAGAGGGCLLAGAGQPGRP